jgi:hypothetical protein
LFIYGNSGIGIKETELIQVHANHFIGIGSQLYLQITPINLAVCGLPFSNDTNAAANP